ncbi:MAG: PrkA family serine protein kinase [Myxococcaceae bacterium]
MNAKECLESVGKEVSRDFVQNRTLLSYEEYIELVVQRPRSQARNAAQYLRDTMDFFGSAVVPHPTGNVRRFKIFDITEGERQGRVAGQEEVQNAIYRLVGNFARTGRVNKLILLHGPNGSAKSSLVESLKRGLERYSRESDGALYRLAWVFPSDKLVKGNIGFGERPGEGGELASWAHLDSEQVDVRMACELRDHPLFLLPRPERRRLLEQALQSGADGKTDLLLSEYVLEGELCHKCRRVYGALLAASGGDYFKVLRHVQVERFYLSRHYLVGAVTVEPQLSADASYHQVTADRSQTHLPASLHNVVLFEPQGPLVNANRGLIEYADLLKRPLEAFKYLLGFSETGEVPMEHFVLQLDEVLLASSNEKHLTAFKELPDFASFKGRIELVRVPYLRRWKVEQEVYDAQVTPVTVGKHIAPHATAVAAMWAVLTRLKKPVVEHYPEGVREVIDQLTPVEKLHLYQEGTPPDRLSLGQAKELRQQLAGLYEESEAYPNYEGRTGASAREIKTALFNAAQNPEYRCLSALAVLDELLALCQDKSVYEFLQEEVVEGYHDHEEFVRAVELEYLEAVDAEVRESMGLVSEGQYVDLFERYIQHVSHWVKNEKMRNRITGDMERPDEKRMAEMESIVMPRGDDSGEFRRGLIAQVGAHKLENPEGPMAYPRIFPDLFRRLRAYFFEERKKALSRNSENLLRALSDERAALSTRELQAVDATLGAMRDRFGYCDACAREAILFLTRKRYAQ